MQKIVTLSCAASPDQWAADGVQGPQADDLVKALRHYSEFYGQIPPMGNQATFRVVVTLDRE